MWTSQLCLEPDSLANQAKKANLVPREASLIVDVHVNLTVDLPCEPQLWLQTSQLTESMLWSRLAAPGGCQNIPTTSRPRYRHAAGVARLVAPSSKYLPTSYSR